MTIMIRRFTIFTAIMALFAVAFASLVVSPNRNFQRVNAGTNIACIGDNNPSCQSSF